MEAGAIRKIVPKVFNQGDAIFREGSPSDGTMYFIFDGQLSVRKDGFGEIRVMQAGHFFGEMALVNQKPRSATVSVVSKQAKVGAIDKGTFAYLARTKPTFLLNLVRVVANRALKAKVRS